MLRIDRGPLQSGFWFRRARDNELTKLAFLTRCAVWGFKRKARNFVAEMSQEAKNVRARFDSNLPSRRNRYKQISELSAGGFLSRYGFPRNGAERLIRSESLD